MGSAVDLDDMEKRTIYFSFYEYNLEPTFDQPRATELSRL
jgi:hypothetical protein